MIALEKKVERDYQRAIQMLAVFSEKNDKEASAYWLGVATGLANLFFAPGITSQELLNIVLGEVQEVKKARSCGVARFDA